MQEIIIISTWPSIVSPPRTMSTPEGRAVQAQRDSAVGTSHTLVHCLVCRVVIVTFVQGQFLETAHFLY